MQVNCAVYRDGQKRADIEVDAISGYLAQHNCFVGIALMDPESGELDVLQRKFGLHELAIDDVRMGHQPPKIDEYGDSLFVVIHTAELDGDGVKQAKRCRADQHRGQVGKF